MSGGGGGVIILKSVATSGGVTDSVDKDKLLAIADRSIPHCSMKDAWAAVKIIWKYLRRP